MHKQLILVLAFICAGYAVFAQPEKDSLHQVWSNAALPDTQRLNAMEDLITGYYLASSPDSALILADLHHTYARQKGLKKATANSLLLRGYAFNSKGDYRQALDYFRESLSISEQAGFSSEEATSSAMIGQMLGRLGDYETAQAYLERSLAICQRIQFQRGLAFAYSSLAAHFSLRGDDAQALPYIRKGIETSMSQGDSVSVAESLNTLGSAYQNLGRIPEAKAAYLRAAAADTSHAGKVKAAMSFVKLAYISANEGQFDEGLAYIGRSLELSRAAGAQDIEARCWNLAGAIHTRQGLYVQAVEELNTALRIYESLNNTSGIAGVLGNLANAQLDQQTPMDALATYEKAKQLFEQMGQKSALTQINSSIGNVYRDLGQPEQALPYYQTSLDIARELQSPAAIAYALGRIADLYYRQLDLGQAKSYILEALSVGDTPDNLLFHVENLSTAGRIFQQAGDQPKAIAYARKAYDTAREIGVVSTMLSSSEVLYRAYKATGQAAKALEMHELYITYRDSIINEENNRAILKQQMQYEYEKKEAAAKAEQDKKDALAQAELGRRNLQRNASLGGLGLVAVLAGVLFVNGRRRRQTNILLTAQKAEIQAKSNQNELLLKEIHHRVKNSLQTISSLLYLQSAHIKDPEVRDAVAAGQHRVESMALIHQKLYQRDTLAAIEMKDYLSNLVTSLISTFAADPERIRVSLDMPELELDVDTAVPLGLIVNELITNSLKYAFPDGREGTVTVRLHRTGEALELLVSDDGIGSANTATGTAFGSQLVRLLTSQLGGTLEQGSGQGYWTKVRVG